MNKRIFQSLVINGLCLLLLVLMVPKISRGGEYKYDNYYWLSANINLKENDFSSIAYIEDWDQIVATSMENSIYTKKSYENQWSQIPIETEERIISVLLDPCGRIIARTPLSLLIKEQSTAGWKHIKLPISETIHKNIHIYSIVALDSILLVDQTDLWMYSHDAWKHLANPNQLIFLSFAYDSIKNLLFAGTYQNGLWSLDLISGTMTKNLFPLENSSIDHLFIPKDDNNSWFVVTYAGVYRSLDGGTSFELAGSMGEKNQVYQFCEDETRSGVFFAFTKQGVFLSVDQGMEWIPMQHGIENIETRAGCFVPYEQCFYIATLGKGIRSSFAIPNQPEPIQPKEGEDVFYFKPTLAWNLFGGNNLPGSYHIIVSPTKDFSRIVFEKQNIMGDSTLIPEQILELHRLYYWKVRVETQYWTSDWSPAFCFTVRQRWTFSPNQTKYHWNEKKVTLSEIESIAPFIDSGFFYLPLRSFLESLGAKIDWNPKKEEIAVLFKEKSMTISIRSTENNIQIKNNRCYIPIRFLADYFGWTIEWDSKHGTVILKELK